VLSPSGTFDCADNDTLSGLVLPGTPLPNELGGNLYWPVRRQLRRQGSRRDGLSVRKIPCGGCTLSLIVVLQGPTRSVQNPFTIRSHLKVRGVVARFSLYDPEPLGTCDNVVARFRWPMPSTRTTLAQRYNPFHYYHPPSSCLSWYDRSRSLHTILLVPKEALLLVSLLLCGCYLSAKGTRNEHLYVPSSYRACRLVPPIQCRISFLPSG
jgi:hypothetical protein